MTIVHILVYSHRFGEDISVYSTENKAHEVAAMIIAKHLHEIQHPQAHADIASALAAHDHRRALEIWECYQSRLQEEPGGEHIDIMPKEVDGPLRNEVVPHHGC